MIKGFVIVLSYLRLNRDDPLTVLAYADCLREVILLAGVERMQFVLESVEDVQIVEVVLVVLGTLDLRPSCLASLVHSSDFDKRIFLYLSLAKLIY